MKLLKTIMAISFGAAIGACLRWTINSFLNQLIPNFSLGTLTANLTGCFLIGIFLYIVSIYPNISEFWRMLVVVGFLGSLTTFSAFSSEIFLILQEKKWVEAMIITFMNVIGSLLSTFMGYFFAFHLKKIM